MVVRSSGLPDGEMMPYSRSTEPLCLGVDGEAGISGDLSAVIEVSGESFRPEDRSELWPNEASGQLWKDVSAEVVIEGATIKPA